MLRIWIVIASLCSASFASGGSAEVNWTGMMLRFLSGPGTETQAGATYASNLALDTLPPTTLQPGLLQVDYFSAAPVWRVVGFYRIETPGNPRQPQPRFDDFVAALPTTDRDGDSVPDIVELENGVSGEQTTGFFENQGRMDDLVAVWSRPPGGAAGKCVVQFSGTTNPGDPNAYFISRFTNDFTITTLEGSCLYATGLHLTTGHVAIARSAPDHAYETGTANVIFTRSEPDHLALEPGRLHYYGDLQLGYRPETLFLRAGTRYWGIITITNGALGSLDDRYRSWLWRMHSADDQDQNGIPDLSDAAEPFAPRLKAVPEPGAVRLELTGEPEVAYSLITSTNVAAPNGWTAAATLTAPDGITLPAPTSGANYWRAKFP